MQVKFIAMTMVLICFYHETSIFNPFDVVLNKKYNWWTDSSCRFIQRMTWPQSLLFLLIFRALLKTKKDLKCTFISFSSFNNSEKGTPGVFFQHFSDSDNVKILPSTCYFELVKVNELISTQYKFNPFPDWDILFTKKGIPWLNMTKEVLSDIIL